MKQNPASNNTPNDNLSPAQLYLLKQHHTNAEIDRMDLLTAKRRIGEIMAERKQRNREFVAKVRDPQA